MVGPIGAIMLFGMFTIIYMVWGAGYVAQIGQLAITEGGLVGFEAFFYANLNLWIILIMLLAMLGWAYFGSNE